MDRLLVATMNIRNLADRWEERLPLLLADMAALQPDLLALNEVVYPMQQDRLLGAAGEGRYEAVRGWAPRVLEPIADTYKFKTHLGKIRQVDWHDGYTAAAGHALYTARAYPRGYWERVAFVTEPTGHLVRDAAPPTSKITFMGDTPS